MKIKLEKYHYIAFIGWVSKAISILLSFFSIRIIINLIGLDGFGIHSYLLNLLPWLSLLNLGTSYSIQNIISEKRSKNQDYSSMIKVINIVSLFIFIVIIIFSFFISFFISSLYLMNNISYYTILVVIFFISTNSIIEIYSKVLFAEHRGHISNLFPLISSSLTILFLLMVDYLGIDNINIVLLGYFFPSLIIMFLSFYIVNRSISYNRTENSINIYIIFKKAFTFFIFMLMANFILKIDYFIIAKLLEPKDLAIYSLVQKYYMISLLLYSIILDALWPIFSEELKKKNFKKVNYLILKNITTGFIIITIFIVIFIFFNEKILLLLSGKKIVLDLNIVLFASIYLVLRVVSDTYSIVFLSMDYTNIINYIIPVQALIAFLFEYYFTIKYGLAGIFIGLSISFILTTIWILPLIFHIKIVKNHL